MLRSFLLLLCWTSSVHLDAKDRMEDWLPRTGQNVDLWNADLSQKLGRIQIDVRENFPLYTLRSEHVPTLHYMLDEQRFSVPGVAATGKAQKIDEQGTMRFVYRGSNTSGAIEKQALIELVRLDNGSCQLSWKLSVINRGERMRHQEGAMAYACREELKTKMHRQKAVHLLPGQDSLK